MQAKIDTNKRLIYFKPKRFWIKYCYEPIYSTLDERYLLLKCTKTILNIIKPAVVDIRSVTELLQFKYYLESNEPFPFKDEKSEIYVTLALKDNKFDWTILNHDQTVDFFEAYKIGLKLSGGI